MASIPYAVGQFGNALSNLQGSESHGGSAQSSYNQSEGTSMSQTHGQEASEWSAKEAEKARQFAAEQAEINRQFQERLFREEMAYNANEAQKQRDYQQAQVDVANRMADTIYTRSAANMREAGINPILAFSHGLSGAGSGTVSSGQSASVGGSPSGNVAQSFMGQSFADQNSASSQWSKGEASGSSWQNSESGLAKGLQQMGELIGAGLNALSSAKFFEINLGDKTNAVKDIANDVKQGVTKTIDKVKTKMNNRAGTPVKANKNSKSSGGGRKF